MPKSPVVLTYIGGPTVLIEYGPFRLLTDPTFDPSGGAYTTSPVTLHKTASPALQAEAVGRVDYVLLSHDHHFDNLDHAGRAMLANARRVFTTTEGAARLGGNSTGLHDWETVDVTAATGETLRITATPCRHGPAGMDRGAVVGFALSLAGTPDQVLYFSGDTVWYEGVAEVARRIPVTTALLNLGAARVPEVGPFHLTMTAAEAVTTAQAMPAAAIVPSHFEGWRHFSEGRAEIQGAFDEAGLAGRLRWLVPGQPVSIA